MATWVTHLIVADKILSKSPRLLRSEFCVGNIAPDCNIENQDFTSFIPSREVTHWMRGSIKRLSDGERFLNEYVKAKKALSPKEESFLLGYYVHLITDAEFRNFTHNEERLRASWRRIKSIPALKEKSSNMPETWETVKALIPKNERFKDIYSIERKYLNVHPDSGYLTEILLLESFPDYIDYLPKNAVVRKIRVMGYIPRTEKSEYPYVAFTEDEYFIFIEEAAEKSAHYISAYYNEKEGANI